MRAYQPYLFSDKTKMPKFLPLEAVFVYENKRYINFANFDCRNLFNNEYLKETAKFNIETQGISPNCTSIETLAKLTKMMGELKRLEAILLFPDEISAGFALFSIFGPKVTFFIDYETSSGIKTVLQYRNIEHYTHRDIAQFGKLLSAHSERVIVIDGMYDWLGYTGPINALVKVAKEHKAIIIANETDSFGLLGRDGRGFVDLFNIYDEVHFEIGSFHRFIGGFGSYIGAKRYLINRIKYNIQGVIDSLPEFMIATNIAGLELIKKERYNKSMFQKLWSHSRYFISRLKQIGFKTNSETPIIILSLNNNEKAKELRKRLFEEGIIVEQQKERVRIIISIEHTKPDLDYTLDRLEALAKEPGLVN